MPALRKFRIPLLPTLLLAALCCVPVHGQKLLIGFGAGVSTLTLFSLGEQDYRDRYQLAETRGFPAPGLLLHLGYLFRGERFSLGFETGDLDRGFLVGQPTNGKQQVDHLNHTPFMARLNWYVKPYSAFWNFSFRLGGGLVSQHLQRRNLTTVGPGQTNVREENFPFQQSAPVVCPGVELLYRSNLHALIVLSYQQPFLIQNPLFSYPFFSISLQLEIASMNPSPAKKAQTEVAGEKKRAPGEPRTNGMKGK
ncbi:MAG: hypothetical protein J0L75_01525 [Spirochaetes bacterium]|nr:hypothetical protein [Spirochaetota bacterium]